MKKSMKTKIPGIVSAFLAVIMMGSAVFLRLNDDFHREEQKATVQDTAVQENGACAVMCKKQKGENLVRVLLKNKNKMYYKCPCVKSNKSCTINGKERKSRTVLGAKTLLKGKKNGDEVCIRSNGGKFYLCDHRGNKTSSGYEGNIIFRKMKGGYAVINELPVETYLRYVVPSEMPHTFSMNALRAQAVSARTFTYQKIHGNSYAKYGADMDDSVACQVYHASKPNWQTDQAILDTKNKVMTYKGKLISSYYFSTSAGYSENFEVWNSSSPGYLVAANHTMEKKKDLSDKKNFHDFITRNVKSYDSSSPYYRWTVSLSAKRAKDPVYGKLKKIVVQKRSKSGYVLSLKMVFSKGSRVYTRESDIRAALGKYFVAARLSDGSLRKNYQTLPSACFEVKGQKKGKIILTGGGYGHDIGMSQYGANAMARNGKSWKTILKYYYKGIKIKSVK